MTPSPKTKDELTALPELPRDDSRYVRRAMDDGAVYAWREGERVFAPVWDQGKWWKQEQRIL